MNSAFMMKSMPVRSTGSPEATYDPTAANPAQYTRLSPVIQAYVQKRSTPCGTSSGWHSANVSSMRP